VRPDKNTRALAGTPVGNGFPSTGGVVGDFPQPMLPYPVFSKAYLLILFNFRSVAAPAIFIY
jgi:hypothetical protein